MIDQGLEATGLKTKTIVHKSAAPIYAAAVTWVLYALLFPLYQVGHFLLAAAAAAVVALIARIFCKDVTEEVEIPEEPVTTGNPELDKMIADGNGAIQTMRALNDSIQDETISAQIDRLATYGILAGTGGGAFQPEGSLTRAQLCALLAQALNCRVPTGMSYYLPTTIKLLTAYDQMSRQGVSGENITGTMEKVEGMMSSIVQAFEKQLDSLYGAEALDISTDITVLENMMAREGLTDDPLHRTAAASAEDTPEDGGFTL